MELVEEDMVLQGSEGLVAWMRTTWMVYTKRVPENMRQTFILEFADAYLKEHPLDDSGRSHVKMIRLEVEAHI